MASRSSKKPKKKTQNELLGDVAAQVRFNPLQHALFAYPWGEKGTVLERWEGPDKWQARIMLDISHALLHGWVMNNGVRKEQKSVVRVAVASGHGIGKSALMAMLTNWFNNCMPFARGVTTAVKETQLRTKTWKEVAKWHNMSKFKHWQKWTSTQFQRIGAENEWFTSAEPWSEHNTEAFAGLHGENVMVQYDEASGVAELVWEVSEGSLTDSGGYRLWIVFGNPTTTSGRFYKCFTEESHLWLTYNIDSREAQRTDTDYLNELVALRGEDSDYTRVRIRGLFPKNGDINLIGSILVDEAMRRTINLARYSRMPKILGVDVAGDGSDLSAIICRQGHAAYDLKKFAKLDIVEVAGMVVNAIKEHKPDKVFIDNGYGKGVVDILHGLEYRDIVVGVWFQYSADEPEVYLNKRAEMWYRMRDWLKEGGCLEEDDQLRAGLAEPYRIFNDKQQKHALESKADIKKRESKLDCADALALTFAYDVQLPVTDGMPRSVRPKGAGYSPIDYTRKDGTASYNPIKMR